MGEAGLEIKYFLISAGTEIFEDLKQFPVEGLTELEMQVTIGIGEVGSLGATDFSLMIICGETQRMKHAAKRAKRENVKFKRFAGIDMKVVEDWIRDRVKKCDAGSYEASLPCLRRSFDWEYEGCQPLVSR